MSDAVEKIRNNVKRISENYFVDPSWNGVGDRRVHNYNLAMLGVTYAMGYNALLQGEPGFGKTTACKIILSTHGGLPFDLFEAAQIQGHPEQTKEEMAHRPYYPALSEEEQVVYQPAIYLTGLLMDEISRLPPGKQSFFLNAVETGRWSYLGSSVYFGKQPFFATTNYEDSGNHKILPPLLDRFGASLEFGRIPGPRARLLEARKKQKELCNPKLTNEILNFLNDRTNGGKKYALEVEYEKRKFVLAKAKEYGETTLANLGLQRLDEKDVMQFREAIEGLGLSGEADIYLDFLEPELNVDQLNGQKRRSDIYMPCANTRPIASIYLVGAGLSNRGRPDLENYARALALYMGDKEVTRAHVDAVLPHVLSHRLDFQEDFKKNFRGTPRVMRVTGVGENEQTDLVRRLVECLEANWTGNKWPIMDPGQKALEATKAGKKEKDEKREKREDAVERRGVYQQVLLLNDFALGEKQSENQVQEAEILLERFDEDPYNVDHPYVREFMMLNYGTLDGRRRKRNGKKER